MAQRLAKPEHVEDLVKFFKAPMTFFKHADRDPQGVLDFHPEANEFIFIFCIGSLEALGEQASDLQRALVLWHSLHRPTIFLEGKNPLHDNFGVDAINDLKRLGKRDFLKGALLGYAKSRAAD